MEMKQIIGILAIIGAILMISGIFLSWYTIDTMLGDTNWSGWELLTEGGDVDGAKQTMTKYAPIPLLIAGILTILIFVANFIDALKMPKFVPAISLIVTIIALVFSVVAIIYINDFTGSAPGVEAKIGIGIILCLVGTILAIIGPILALIKRENPVAAYEASFDHAASVVSSDDKE